MEIICKHCKKKFNVSPCLIKTKKFCSRKCTDAFRKHDPNYKGYWFGKKRDAATIKKMKFYCHGHIPWNKGIKRPEISGKNHPMWKGGKRIGEYVQILNHAHPFCTKSGYVFKHRLVMEKHIGRYIQPGEVVHHINGNKLDNRIKNLILLENESMHRKLYHPRSIGMRGVIKSL